MRFFFLPMKIYIYKNCSTCRKAIAWLDDRGLAYEKLPIRETPPSLAELEQMLAENEGQLRPLFNTSGADYRELGMKDRLPQLSTAEALSLLSSRGNLVKRPFLIGDSIALVGFKESVWEAAFDERKVSGK